MYCLKVGIYFVLTFSFLSCNTDIDKHPDVIIAGKVIAIKDGDTIDILFDGKPLRVRLAHVDCPEIRRGQPFGKAAKQKASELCFGQEVQVLGEGKHDRYNRLIGVVINANNQNVNKEMVRAGLAWHYIKYSSDSSYANLEIEARKNKLGLWEEDNPTPPWEWRNVKKNKRESQPLEELVE